jgi:ATP-binding cassette subfamily F protein uup
MSAGELRRLLLARALAPKPDLLLLDEPTNHLDIPAIEWLEQTLARPVAGALLFVTHDRAFLQALATRIIELDRGRLASYTGDFRSYLERRAADLAAESAAQLRFDRKLSQEEAWIRQGIKARRTRNEGRVKVLERLRVERRERRSKVGLARLSLQEAQRSGELVLRLEDLSFGYGERQLVEGLTLDIFRGDRVGVVGPNGAGKTTLLRLMLGELAPQHGSVQHGTHLQVRWFDQLREQLDPQQRVIDAVAYGQQTITWQGRPRPVFGYLQDFLFTPQRAQLPVAQLSGGERQRLLLARVLLEPANLLVLDEPTNDLDLETIELLEELLLEYPGTLLVTSHDRTFLDRVVTTTLVLDGTGRVEDVAGGYSDWRALLASRTPEPRVAAVSRVATSPAAPTTRRGRKLGNREQRELTELPQRIEQLESEQHQLSERMASPSFYQQPAAAIASANARLAVIAAELERSYSRWEELEGQEH